MSKKVRVVGHWSGAILCDEDGMCIGLDEGAQPTQFADVTMDEAEWERVKAKSAEVWQAPSPEMIPGALI